MGKRTHPFHIGDRIGLLEVIAEPVSKDYYGNLRPFVWCKCHGCDGVREFPSFRVLGKIQNARVVSCGCVNRERIRSGRQFRVHGDWGSSLHKIWLSMRERCANPRCKIYRRYGGKGIKVCSDWGTYSVFQDWAMSKGYKRGLQVDRINSSGNYEPSNCQLLTRRNHGLKTWADRQRRAEQAKSLQLAA